MIVDKYDDNCFWVNLLDGIEIANSIDLVQASVEPSAWSVLFGADGTVGFALHAATTTITPCKK